MRSSFFSSIAVVVAILPCIISAQSEGDVRLEGSSSSGTGRLEIFWKGKWSTFCGLSSGGAQAACRQLGFMDATYFGPLRNNPKLSIPEADSETPIAIQDTNCRSTFLNALLHVLRCGYNTTVDATCTHKDDIVLLCEPLSLYTHPYDTQVRLVGASSNQAPSSGTLEIYLNNKWGNVCGDKFDKAAADSACRQMGYTNASHYTTTSKTSKDTVWLRDLSCKGASCDCLSGCFGNNPSKPTTCSNGDITQVTCTFDVAIAEKASSGSEDICENKQSVCSGPSGGSGLSPGAAAGIAIAVIAVVILAIVGVVVAVFVLLPKWRKRRYTSVN